MRLITTTLIFALFAALAQAQERESKFDDYADYDAFVERNMMDQNFIALLLRLGAREKYTDKEMSELQSNLREHFGGKFQSSTVFNIKELGGGISQEARAYWLGQRYGFFYALLHDRPDGLVVIQFSLNTLSQPIIDRF